MSQQAPPGYMFSGVPPGYMQQIPHGYPMHYNPERKRPKASDFRFYFYIATTVLMVLLVILLHVIYAPHEMHSHIIVQPTATPAPSPSPHVQSIEQTVKKKKQRIKSIEISETSALTFDIVNRSNYTSFVTDKRVGKLSTKTSRYLDWFCMCCVDAKSDATPKSLADDTCERCSKTVAVSFIRSSLMYRINKPISEEKGPDEYACIFLWTGSN